MNSLSNSILPNRNIYFFLSVCIVFLFLMIYKKLQKERHNPFKDKRLPPEMWFYSQLLDIEIGVKNPEDILHIFLEYLQYKYRCFNLLETDNDVVNLLKEKEELNAIRIFQYDLYLEIKSLKHKNADDVITYVKSIKFNFNKDDLSEWLAQQKADSGCNNC